MKSCRFYPIFAHFIVHFITLSAVFSFFSPALHAADSEVQNASSSPSSSPSVEIPAAASAKSFEKTPVRIAYFSPSDCTPLPDRAERLGRVMKHVQNFYRTEMERCGYGPMTFSLEWNTPSELKIYDVRGIHPQAEYGRNDALRVRQEVNEALKKQGLDPNKEFIVIFEQLLRWEGSKAVEVGPYVGGGSNFCGNAWVFDDAKLDPSLLSSQEPGGYYHGPCTLGSFNSHYIGGIAHEMGHMFGLPHVCQLDSELRERGHSLMGGGNHTFGEELRGEGKGTFLHSTSALRLTQNHAFNGIKTFLKTYHHPFSLKITGLKYENSTIQISGKVLSSEPVLYAVLYHDKKEPAADYDAKAWTVRIAPDGTFSHEITECEKNSYTLRLACFFADGTVSSISKQYTLTDTALQPDPAP